MKKNFLWILLAVGITVSAFGGYYLHKSNYFAGNSQMSENDLGETSESSEEPRAEKPGEAYEWRLLAWRDENGYIPPNGLSEAIRQRDLYLQQTQQQTQQQAQRQTEKQAAPEAVARLNWVSKGPQNVGGRTRSLVFHPNGTTIYAGSVSGGMWKSTDGGTSWFAMNGNLQNYAIGSMAIHPTNPDILYVGTGEGFDYPDFLRGAGMFKTADGGMTWTLVPGTNQWESVNRISIAHDNPNKILVAISGGIARSDDGGNNWSVVRSAVKSLHVAFDPMNSTKAVGEIQEVTGSDPSHRAVFSIDGGLTWQNSFRDGNEFNLTGIIQFRGSKRIELAYSPSSPNIVYALFPSDPDFPTSRIARSTDGGQNFTTRASTIFPSLNASYYINSLWVSPTNPDFVIAGSIHLFKSINGGDTFAQISNGYIMTVQPHVDQHRIVSHPGYNGTTNKIVYVGNDGGVFRTNDITTANPNGSGGWERKDATYQTTQYYGAAGNGTTGLIYGGTQDNGTLKLLPSSQEAVLSSFDGGGDGGFSAIDPTDERYCYGEQPSLRIHRSSDCNTSQPLAQGIFDGITDVGVAGKTNFIAPFVLDPNDPNRMFAGGRSLWRTDSVRFGDPVWDNIRAGDPDPNNIEENISAIAVKQGTPGDSDIVWIALSNGKVYKTDNGTATTPNWTTVDDNGSTNPIPPIN